MPAPEPTTVDLDAVLARIENELQHTRTATYRVDSWQKQGRKIQDSQFDTWWDGPERIRVEVVGGEHTSAETIEQAQSVYARIGMRPIHVRVEIDAFIGDRLLEAVWREALWLVADGVATTQEIDDVMTHGFGLRWAQMGLFETYRVAGGTGGFRHFMEQFGPALELPWTKLMDTPEFTPELVDTIVTLTERIAEDGTVLSREGYDENGNEITAEDLPAEASAGRAATSAEAPAAAEEAAADIAEPVPAPDQPVEVEPGMECVTWIESDWMSQISRTVVVGDQLHAIAERGILTVDLDTFVEESKLTFPSTDGFG